MKQLAPILILAMVILSIVGMADAGYVTYEEFAGKPVVCGAGFDCGAVLQSKWSKIGPIPVSLLGLGYYATVFVLAIATFLEKDLVVQVKPAFTNRFLLTLLTSLGFLFSLYLLSLMAFVIQAWCLYCLISATTSSLLFFVTMLYRVATRPTATG